MSTVEQLLANNEQYARSFNQGELPMPPSAHVAVVACMDARLDVYGLLGLELGQAHVIRNAGGVLTDDVIRSLIISQRLLGTRSIVLIHHSDCGMLTFKDEQVLDQIAAETGRRPPFALHAFADLEDDVRQAIASLRQNPFLPHKDDIRGFVYDVKTGRLNEVLLTN